MWHLRRGLSLWRASPRSVSERIGCERGAVQGVWGVCVGLLQRFTPEQILAQVEALVE